MTHWKFILTLASAAVLQASPPGWRIKIGDRDVTEMAAPLERAGSILVNLSELAPSAGIELSVTGVGVLLRSRNGRQWTGRLGGAVLIASNGLRVFSHPLVAQEQSVYAPVDMVADVAGLDYTSGPAAREVQFTPAAAILPVKEGWQEISIAKTPEEKDVFARMYGPRTAEIERRARQVVLPPSHDTLKLQVSQGYVQGADWGTDLLGSGSVSGFQTDFWSQTTMGPRGLMFLTGRVSLGSPDGGWTAQGGDLASQIWGWARGARFSLRSKSWHSPSLSYYAKTERVGSYRNALAYSDRFQIAPWLSVGGEVASDRSVMLRPSLRTRRLSVTPFYRLTPGENLSRGVFGSLSLWRRASVYGRFTRMRTVRDDRTAMAAGVRIPLIKRTNLNLEHTIIDSRSNRSEISAATLSIPVGRVRLFGRYQYRDSQFLPQDGRFGRFGTKQHEFFGGATYTSGRRLNIQFQTASRWREDGAIDQWQQVVGHLGISERSMLDGVSVLPDATTPSQHRVRYTRQIKNDLAVVAEYGNVSPYQGVEVEIEDRRFKLMLRKDFGIHTPTRGAEVQGLVADPFGRPLEGALVRLGDYAALTDKEGRYRFHHMPSGAYGLHVDDATLPADYSVTAEPKTLEIHAGSTESVDWTVMPLNTLSGRVCEDKNGNGVCDPEEGIERVPVYLGGRVTATRDGGGFLFHNVLPGEYEVKLDPKYLPGGFVPASALDTEVTVKPRKPARFVQFFLEERKRPVIFQELP